MTSPWVRRLQERSASAPPVEPEQDTGLPNSTLRYHRFRAAHEADGGDVTPEQWLGILEQYFFRCAYCLKRVVPLEMEHVVDFNQGGKHNSDNVVPACKSCNSSKKETPLLVWLATRAAKGKKVGA